VVDIARLEENMANTTFSGPIRSQNGMKLISKDSTTGLVSDRTLGDYPQDTRRFYLDEWFLQRPGLNANIDQVSTVEVQRALNRNWEALGTNMTTALCTFNTTSAGIVATTAGADQDQAVLTPHLDTAATAWAGCLWGTENQVHWETSIALPAIDNQKVWAGLKLTNDQLIATDADQAYFKFQTDATNSEAFDDFTLLHFVHSIGGTDHISVLPITVAADTIYHLKITFDSSRQMSIFVNGVQYNITSTSGSTGGTSVTTGTTKSAAMTDDVDLIPYIGIEAGAAAAEAIHCHYVKMSRIINE
tara:strand:+ start:88 stop:996 length:909 start_codon:yes stop_codon:yes gene_type:complete